MRAREVEEEEQEPELDQNDGEEEEQDNGARETLKEYLMDMEGRVRKAEDEKNALLEENHQLRLKMKEVLTAFSESTKGGNAKAGSQQAATAKAVKAVEAENLKLRTELKKSLEDKLELIQKIDKYDRIVEEMKGYNQELIAALKQYEEQNTLLRNQKTFSQDEINKIRSDIENYQKKVAEP